MKKSELRQLIKEQIKQVITEGEYSYEHEYEYSKNDYNKAKNILIKELNLYKKDNAKYYDNKNAKTYIATLILNFLRTKPETELTKRLHGSSETRMYSMAIHNLKIANNYLKNLRWNLTQSVIDDIIKNINIIDKYSYK